MSGEKTRPAQGLGKLSRRVLEGVDRREDFCLFWICILVAGVEVGSYHMDAHEVTIVSTLSLIDFVDDLIDDFYQVALAINKSRTL